MSYKLSIVKNKMMKRIINILILLCCIASLSSCGNSTEERSRVLKIYNWADYIDEDVLAEFPDWYKQQTGEDLRIIYQVFDINEIMLTKIERGHEDFDVVCPSEYIIERMLRKDLLLPIDRNFGHTPDYIPNVSPYIRHELNKTSTMPCPTCGAPLVSSSTKSLLPPKRPAHGTSSGTPKTAAKY